MNLRQPGPSSPARKITNCLCSLTIIIALAIGCSRSDSSQSPIVDPPAPQTEPAVTSERSEPRTELKGGIELPEGEIPSPESNQQPATSGGIEMPDDVNPDPQSSNTGTAASAPKILYATWDEIQARARSTGKVTIVDLWSLSCEPCLKEFPGLVALHQQLGSSVQCIAVDMDYDGRKSRPPQWYADRVGAFLASVGAVGFPTYISETPSEDVFTLMQIVSLPAVLVYGADGTVVKKFVDAGENVGFNYESDIAPLVARLNGE